MAMKTKKKSILNEQLEAARAVAASITTRAQNAEQEVISLRGTINTLNYRVNELRGDKESLQNRCQNQMDSMAKLVNEKNDLERKVKERDLQIVSLECDVQILRNAASRASSTVIDLLS